MCVFIRVAERAMNANDDGEKRRRANEHKLINCFFFFNDSQPKIIYNSRLHQSYLESLQLCIIRKFLAHYWAFLLCVAAEWHNCTENHALTSLHCLYIKLWNFLSLTLGQFVAANCFSLRECFSLNHRKFTIKLFCNPSNCAHPTSQPSLAGLSAPSPGTSCVLYIYHDD